MRSSNNNNPLHTIAIIRELYGNYEPNSGGCLKMYLLLKHIYPEARGFYNSNHVITEIRGVAYDQHGVAVLDDSYLELREFGGEHFRSAFKDTIEDKKIIKI